MHRSRQPDIAPHDGAGRQPLRQRDGQVRDLRREGPQLSRSSLSSLRLDRLLLRGERRDEAQEVFVVRRCCRHSPPLPSPPPAAHYLALGSFIGWPITWWLTVLLCVLFSLFLVRRPLGRHIYAIGGNTEAARLAGVNVRGVIIFVYAMTGMLVGLASVIQLGQSGTVQPNAGLGLELQVIAATVIGGTSILGGKGTVVGAVLGALLVEAVHNALITIGNLGLIEGLIIGVLILVAVGVDVIQNRRAIRT